MPDTKRTPPRDDAGGRGQHRPFGRNGDTGIIPADPADVNLADALPEGMEHVSAPLARFMADLRRKMIFHELAETRDAMERLREACE